MGVTPSTHIEAGSVLANTKSVRRKATAKPLAVKKVSAPAEILFEQAPNPLREPVPPYIWIDYPTQNEQLKAPAYVVRLGVGGATSVEIKINKSTWQPCRLTSGYWWFDWDAIRPGKHTLTARMRTVDGRRYRTPPTHCQYR